MYLQNLMILTYKVQSELVQSIPTLSLSGFILSINFSSECKFLLIVSFSDIEPMPFIFFRQQLPIFLITLIDSPQPLTLDQTNRRFSILPLPQFDLLSLPALLKRLCLQNEN